METTFKKMVIAVVAICFMALSACDRHTCPTYSQNTTTEERTNG